MRRECFSFQIFPGAEEEYQIRHDTIWPEMLAVLSKSGRKNYTLFRSKLTIVGYYEIDDVDVTEEEAQEIEQVQLKWSQSMEGIIDFATARGENAHVFHEVWHMQ
jgi:L-rhamnose mutarotase